MANPLLKVLGDRVHGRNAILLFDTAATALSSVIVVIAASRALSAGPLDSFSLAQLVLVMLIQSVRTAIWSPALAAQRQTGKARVPLRWVGILAPSIALVVGLAMSFLIPAAESRVHWSLTLIGCCTALLAQDGLRSVLMSRDQTLGALISDMCALLVIAIGTVTGQLPDTASGILTFWAGAMALALVIGLGYLSGGRRSSDLPEQSLRETWRIGRWGALDATFSSVSVLLPFFVATLYVANTSAGPYRILQTAMGPLNIIHTTVVTSFGLDAWQSATREGLRNLNRRTARLTAALGVGVLAYVGIGIPTMIALSGVSHPHLVRISLIVGVSGVIGTLTAPVSAAALSLGYQRFGAMIRFVVVLLAVAISLPWAVNHLVPWRDPIGTSIFLTSVVTFTGWAVGYAVAYSRELRRPVRALPEQEPILD